MLISFAETFGLQLQLLWLTCFGAVVNTECCCARKKSRHQRHHSANQSLANITKSKLLQY